jgi:hypothetical protein
MLHSLEHLVSSHVFWFARIVHLADSVELRVVNSLPCSGHISRSVAIEPGLIHINSAVDCLVNNITKVSLPDFELVFMLLDTGSVFFLNEVATLDVP